MLANNQLSLSRSLLFVIVRLQDLLRRIRNRRTRKRTSSRTCTITTTRAPCPSPGHGPRRRRWPKHGKSTRPSCRRKASPRKRNNACVAASVRILACRSTSIYVLSRTIDMFIYLFLPPAPLPPRVGLGQGPRSPSVFRLPFLTGLSGGTATEMESRT